MNPLLVLVGWFGVFFFFLVFVVVMVCLLAGFAPYILWPGCQSNSKHGAANEYRQKSPRTCLLCLARGPAKRSRGAGTQNHFDFILPPPDEHQQKAVPFFLQRELLHPVDSPYPTSREPRNIQCQSASPPAAIQSQRVDLCSLVCCVPSQCQQKDESLPLPSDTVKVDLAGLNPNKSARRLKPWLSTQKSRKGKPLESKKRGGNHGEAGAGERDT